MAICSAFSIRLQLGMLGRLSREEGNHRYIQFYGCFRVVATFRHHHCRELGWRKTFRKYRSTHLDLQNPLLTVGISK